MDALDFTPATREEKEAFIPQHKSVSYWEDAWRRLKRNHVAMVSLGVIIFLILFAYAGPLFVAYTYEEQVRGSENLAPLANSPLELEKIARGEKVFPHVFGTDTLGRDIFVRVMYGTRVSMIIGVMAAILTLLIGVVYGSISGFIGGRTDLVMMRIVDIIYSVPDVLVVLLLAVTLKPLLGSFADANQTNLMGRLVIALGPSIIAIFIAFALLYWTTLARIVRGQILQLKQQEYVIAAVALGARDSRIIMKHLLPNCVGSLVAATCLQIPIAIFLESFLSFLGLGVNAPMTSLGSLSADALGGMYTYTYRLIIPALILCLLILSFNLFGDGLRDALDPRLKK
ncbi:oligopeptide transport system permease protein OppC [Treponema primitia ZAS-2]|uniref:Oligopeptide transport system permease protein OppC n=1 Tax=Treponema primitia (strain ATCC BAA-887 / DSM 12427 / ZAS-2) TaxID=545694 RepID=F5YQG2_TREPZ|nr:ABC transporter permease [Treponema primitia]AEF86072.1 oligopeptide transport system permease protein OppC [Treponema primitia ZAS-2]